MPAAAVEIEHLTHRYGSRRALDGIDLHVPPGCLFGILGPNGGGKTTLFRILSTLITPTAGRVRVLDIDVLEDDAAVRRAVGIVFQDDALDDELTVSENLRLHAALHGIGRNTRRQRLEALLPAFGLEDRLDDRVDTLSGGLRRRVDLVRGLLHAPRLLLLDEPTTGLDPGARVAFWDTLERLRRREEMTMLLATHAMEEADRCDLLAILDRGRIVARGTPAELKRDVGDETLWMETDDPRGLAARAERDFGVHARVIGARVQVSDPRAHALLPALYEALPGAIHAATIRRPTLEDVFMVHTGHGLWDDPRRED